MNNNANNLKVESIFYNLNELKHEKLCLAQKVQELKAQRLKLEQELEQVGGKCSQIQDKHRRMSETFAVAQQKIDESFMTVRSMEGKINNNRPGMDCIQRKIKEEETCSSESLHEFESCLSSISKELFNARDQHKQQALMDEIAQTEAACQELVSKDVFLQSRDLYDKTKKTLHHKVEMLLAEEDNCSPVDGINGSLRTLNSAEERDKQEMFVYLQRLKAELESVHEALRNAHTCN